jgi:hypothetical protein
MSETRPWTPRRALEAGLVAVVAIGLGWAGWGIWHDRGLEEEFPLIHLGMDRKAVERAIGRPDWEGGCSSYVPYLPREGCARELGYSSAFAPIVPVYYLVQLDRSGRVIEAEPIRSP